MQLLRVFFFTQQSAYAMRISDWSADVFSSYLLTSPYQSYMTGRSILSWRRFSYMCRIRSEEHTSELQSLMRISYAVFCLKKTNEISHLLHTCSQTHRTITDHRDDCNQHLTPCTNSILQRATNPTNTRTR